MRYIKTIKLNSKKLDKKILLEVVVILKNGGIVVFPTDTVYGIIASAKHKKSIKKIFEIKNRPLNKPLSLFVKNLAMAKKLSNIEKDKKNLLKSLWPGKTTAILKAKKNTLPSEFFAKKTIAIRIPDYEPLNFILKKIDTPLVQTSANISGKQTTNDPKKIFKTFEKKNAKPDLIISVGKLAGNKSSTILDLNFDPPKILRP